jgi:hypothetical protein
MVGPLLAVCQEEVDAVIVVARWRQPRRHHEDILEFFKQHQHEIRGFHGMDSNHAASGHALLYDAMVIAPTGHTSALKVP